MPNVLNDLDLVAIVAIIVTIGGPFIFAILIVWFYSRERLKRNKMQAELYAKAIESGQAIPPNLFEERKKKRINFLNTGIILMSLGFGIVLTVAMAEPKYLMKGVAGGMIPFMLGVGFLVIHFISKKRDAVDNE